MNTCCYWQVWHWQAYIPLVYLLPLCFKACKCTPPVLLCLFVCVYFCTFVFLSGCLSLTPNLCVYKIAMVERTVCVVNSSRMANLVFSVFLLLIPVCCLKQIDRSRWQARLAEMAHCRFNKGLFLEKPKRWNMTLKREPLSTSDLHIQQHFQMHIHIQTHASDTHTFPRMFQRERRNGWRCCLPNLN